MKEKNKEVISWFRPDLAYEHLHQIKVTVSYYAGSNDLQGWYNALETEYRYVWEHIRNKAKEKNLDIEWFEERFKKIRGLIYDPRNLMETPRADKIKQRNYIRAREILHELNMIINGLEVKSKLLITTSLAKDPSMAMANYGG